MLGTAYWISLKRYTQIRQQGDKYEGGLAGERHPQAQLESRSVTWRGGTH